VISGVSSQSADPPQVVDSVVGLPHSFWFGNAGSPPNFLITNLAFQVVFPRDVTAAGLNFASFVGDPVHIDHLSLNWTLLSAKGEPLLKSSTLYSLDDSPFFGVAFETPFRSLQIDGLQFSGGGSANWFADDLRWSDYPRYSLFVPRLATHDAGSNGTDPGEYTGIAAANTGDKDASLLITAYDQNGSLISGTDISNPASVELKAGRQLALIDYQVFGKGWLSRNPDGWLTIDSLFTGVAGSFLSFNGSLTTLDGADCPGTVSSSFVVSEIESEGFTQIHAANPGDGEAVLTLELMQSDGTRRGSVTRTVGAHGSFAVLFSDLFPGLVAANSDYLRVNSTQGVVPFVRFGKANGGITGLNGQDAGGGATDLYCPQYVIGTSAWLTTLSIINLDSVAGVVTLEFVPDGSAAPLSTRQVSMAPRGKIYVTDPRFFLDPEGKVVQGYVRVRSAGVRLTGSVTYGDPARSRYMAAVPMISTLGSNSVYSQIASDDSFFTGLAIVNPTGLFNTNVRVEVCDSSGSRIASRILTLSSQERSSRALTEYFPELVGRSITSGYIRISADNPIASIAVIGTNNLSVLFAMAQQPLP
jgi:hypothetical protein